MHSGSRSFLLLGSGERQGKLTPHLQRGSWHSQLAVPQRRLCPIGSAQHPKSTQLIFHSLAQDSWVSLIFETGSLSCIPGWP